MEIDSLRLARLVSLTILVGGCALDDGMSKSSASEVAPVAEVSLGRDRQMTVTNFNQKTADGRPFVLHIDPNQEAYAGYVSLVGGIAPGETKFIYPHKGLAKLNADGTLTVSIFGGRSNDLVIEPSSMTLTVGDPEYAHVIERVGGLQPGQTKPIY